MESALETSTLSIQCFSTSHFDVGMRRKPHLPCDGTRTDFKTLFRPFRINSLRATIWGFEMASSVFGETWALQAAVIPVPPWREESTRQTFGNALSTGWVPPAERDGNDRRFERVPIPNGTTTRSSAPVRVRPIDFQVRQS
jgi:hypothetical protein